MKQALVNDQLTLANADAPATATCSNCGRAVKLRIRQGTYFWRHMQLPPGGCSLQGATNLTLVPADAERGVSADAPRRRTRQIGDLVVELHPDGHSLKLHCPCAKGSGGPSEMVIPVSEVRSLARALLDAVADLAGLAVGDPVLGNPDEGDAGP